MKTHVDILDPISLTSGMLSFYFNSHDEEDLECWGGDLILVDDGIILIQCSDPFKFYLLSECSEPTIQNILVAIEECEED